MIFNSLDFIIFFIVVLIVYFNINEKWKKIWLLAASYFFYMWWNPLYIFLLLASTLTDYFSAIAISKTHSKSRRRLFLSFSLVVNLGLLFFFKYADFFIETVNRLLYYFHTHKQIEYLNLILPVGISFYTFQTLSYTIDVYKGKFKAEKDFIKFALYVSFFPQLVAGPIERADRLLKQFNEKVVINSEKIERGLILIFWGMFLKVVVADNLAPLVDAVFNNPHNYKGLTTFIGIFFFAFQIYCDFAGYSLIAIGSALILGYKLINNFRKPYFAVSLRDFWRRWHISLSTWFRDYVYIPLGGNKVPLPKWIIVVFLTFTLSGAWHGADWTFIIWGVLHAFFYIVEQILRKSLPDKILKFLRTHIMLIIRRLAVFSITLFLWIFFRSETFTLSKVMIHNLFSKDFSIHLNHRWVLLNFVLIGIVLFADFIQKKNRIDRLLMQKPQIVRFAFSYFVLLSLFFIGNWHLRAFIYFQF